MAAVVGRYDLVEDIGVGGTETMTVGRQRLAEVAEAGCMVSSSPLAGGCWKYTWVCRRLVEGRRRTLRPRLTEMRRNAGRGSLPFGHPRTRDRR